MNYRLSLVAGPAVEPVDLEAAKAHLRVDSPDEDDLIGGYCVSARQWAEAFTWRALIEQTWDMKFDYGLPSCIHKMPMPPLISVTSVTYIDGNGDSQTLASSQYTVDAPAGPHADFGRIVPAYGVSWPSTRSVINAATVRFKAGYGDDAEDVPQQIRDAIKLYIGDLYANRESAVTGTIVTPVTRAAESLLYPYRMGGMVG